MSGVKIVDDGIADRIFAEAASGEYGHELAYREGYLAAAIRQLCHQDEQLRAALRGLVYVVEAMNAPNQDERPTEADIDTALDMALAAIRAAVPQEPTK